MKTKLKRLTGILILAMGGLATVNASSAVLVDTTGNPQNTGFSSLTLNNDDWGAGMFSTGSSCGSLGCNLGIVTLRMSTSLPGSNLTTALTDYSNFELSIYSDNGGTSVGGTALTNQGDIHNPVGPIVNSAPGQLYEFAPTKNILLQDNTSYWVRLFGNASGSVLPTWDVVTSVSSSAPMEFSLGGLLGYPPFSLSMRVEASAISAVPLPGAVWLMGSALVGFVGWGRRLRV